MTKVNIVLNKYLKQNGYAEDESEIVAATNIKALLNKIDFTAEVVPESNLDMMSRLLTSLKGEPLNSEEMKIVGEIINY